MYRAAKVTLESLPLLVAALRDSEVQIVYLDEDLPDSVDDNDNSDNDDDNDGIGIDEDNNDDDEVSEYVNTSKLCERTAGCLLHSCVCQFLGPWCFRCVDVCSFDGILIEVGHRGVTRIASLCPVCVFVLLVALVLCVA